MCILMYSRCILSVSYAEDEIHRNTSRIHHDTRIHTLTHGPTRAPLGYTGIQQNTPGYIRSCVSPQVAYNTCRYGRNTKKISYPRRILLIAPALLALLPKGQQALLLLIAGVGLGHTCALEGWEGLGTACLCRALLRRRRLDGLELVPHVELPEDVVSA